MNLSHKIKLKPSKDQITQLKKTCGTARYTYNWALNKYNEYKQNNIKITTNELKKIWNKEKPDWVYESPKDANQQPFSNLNKALTRFFKKKSKYPKFKKKGKNNSFYISNDKFKLDDYKVRIPKIGWIKLTEKLRFNGKIVSATVSNKANDWFISITVETNIRKERISHNKIGVDLGIKEAITTSEGLQIKPPKPFRRQKNKIRKLNRRLSRKKKFSNNWNKQKVKLQKAYLRLSNIRLDFWHKVTSKLCNENQVICLEDLAIKNLIKNRKLSFSLADVGLGMFKTLILYKSILWNNDIRFIDRFYPSSKQCSSCGYIKQDLTLSDRIYSCKNCGLKIDRDLNAAKNIHTVGSTEINVCGH